MPPCDRAAARRLEARLLRALLVAGFAASLLRSKPAAWRIFPVCGVRVPPGQ